jgi:hypothetical protein
MSEVIVVLVKNEKQYSTAVVPDKVKVDYGSQTIAWQAAGPNARFASSDYFWWKTSPPPHGIPTRSKDGKTLTLTYDNKGSEEPWVYGVTIENDDTSISIDPEIDNGPPRP